MDFIEYINTWVKSEVLQGKIMIGFGVLFLIVFISIIKSQNEFLRGALIPLGLLVFVLIGYGGTYFTVGQYTQNKASQCIRNPKLMA